MEEYQNSSRRDFIAGIAGLAVAAGLSGIPDLVEAKNEVIKLTVLHTNDVHSHIDPFDENHPKYPGMGGVARRSAIIKSIRKYERNVLLLDAGDIFQGTPYFNMFGGELELKLMSQMGYDAATIGNHDFDNGVAALSGQLVHARFPMLNSNYDFEGTPMHGKSLSYKIFNKDGLRIGVFGLGIKLKGLVDPRLFGQTKYLDPVDKAIKISSYLKERKKCHLVICLSHLGFDYKEDKISDTRLASMSENIDLVIGGHTHTFLAEPVKIKNKKGVDVLVTQAGWAGLRLGRIDYYFERSTGNKVKEVSTIKDLNKSSEK